MSQNLPKRSLRDGDDQCMWSHKCFSSEEIIGPKPLYSLLIRGEMEIKNQINFEIEITVSRTRKHVTGRLSQIQFGVNTLK